MQFSETKRGYENLWSKAKVSPEHASAALGIAQQLISHRSRYEAVAQKTGVPWWWIAIVHKREADCNFATHLANGDPLERKTVHVPAGRGPFATWEDGAIDALRYMGLDKVTDWSLPRALYEFERYNGWGYLGKTNSPYVWSWTDLYSRGKYQEVWNGSRYVSVYRSGLVDPQPGAAAILKELLSLVPGIIDSAPSAAATPDDGVKWVQGALNKLGFQLVVDGIDGDATQTAVMTFQQQHELTVDGIAGPQTVAALKQALSPSATPSETIMNTLFHWILTNTQINSLIRSSLHGVGIALLLKFGISGTAAEQVLGPVINLICGVVAGGAGLFYSAQTASPYITNPTRIDPTPQA